MNGDGGRREESKNLNEKTLIIMMKMMIIRIMIVNVSTPIIPTPPSVLVRLSKMPVFTQYGREFGSMLDKLKVGTGD